MAVPVSLALLLIGIPYPFLIEVVAGLGEFVPMVGLMLGAVVSILVALGQPAWQLAAVVIFIVFMNLESHILIPRLMSRVLGLSPLLTIIALFVGVKLMGILGGLVALPVAAALHVIVREVVREATRIHPRRGLPRPVGRGCTVMAGTGNRSSSTKTRLCGQPDSATRCACGPRDP